MSLGTFVRNGGNTAWVEVNRALGATSNLLCVRRADNAAWLRTDNNTIKRAWARNAGNTGWVVLWAPILTTPSAPGFSGFQINPPFTTPVRLNVSALEASPVVSINFTIDWRVPLGSWSVLENATLVPTDTDATLDWDPGADGTYEFRCRYRYTDGTDFGPWSSYTTITIDVFI